MKKVIVSVLMATGVLVLAGCGSQPAVPTNPSSSNNGQLTPTQESQPTAGTSVTIQNFAFSPATLTVKKGDTVTWTNNDSAPHQIKSATFNSGQLGKGQSYSFTFTTAGTFDYSCAIHPSMTGKIIVQ